MGATLVASGTAARMIEEAAYRVPVPTPSRAALPLLSVMPGQLFAAALARSRGLDADAPHGSRQGDARR
jgi:fructoselysine-6-P-deglycase FrlB-like protein